MLNSPFMYTARARKEPHHESISNHPLPESRAVGRGFGRLQYIPVSRAPYQRNAWSFNDFSSPVDITFQGESIGSVHGTSEAQAFFGLFSFGDASLQAAARNGNLATINHIDCSVLNILGIYTAYETRVYGQPHDEP